MGRDFVYGAQRSAYAVEPWETVDYADCHDGQTLFDQVLLSCCWCSCSMLKALAGPLFTVHSALCSNLSGPCHFEPGGACDE